MDTNNILELLGEIDTIARDEYAENRIGHEAYTQITEKLKDLNRKVKGVNPSQTSKFLKILDKKVMFIESYRPMDLINMGQLAVEILYTSSDTQVLTTESTKDNINSSFEFDSEDEFYEFIEFLDSRDVKRNNSK